MIKHPCGGSIPHSKFVYLSEDHRWLCWKSPQKDDEKKIAINNIVKIVKEGVENILKGSYAKKISKCLVIVADRNLQF